MRRNQCFAMALGGLTLITCLTVSGCGGGKAAGGGGTTGVTGQYGFSLYWGADTRSLEINARSVRITAIREDGKGTPVSAVFNRPTNIDVPQEVLLPGRFQIGRHRIDLAAFNQPDGQGSQIGIGRMARRMVPDSKNTVRVNIGVARGTSPLWADFSPTSVQVGQPIQVDFVTVPGEGVDRPVSEGEVNILPSASFSLSLGAGVDAQATAGERFTSNSRGFYTDATLRFGTTTVRKRAMRIFDPSRALSNPLVDSPWPTSFGLRDGGRTSLANGPTTAGAVAIRDTGWGAVFQAFGHLAVLPSGDVAVAGTFNSSPKLGVFSPDLSQVRWSVTLPTTTTRIAQVAALANGLLVVQTDDRVFAYDAVSGAADWSFPAKPYFSAESRMPFFDQYIVNSNEFRSVGSGQVVFSGQNQTVNVASDGTAITERGLLYDVGSALNNLQLGPGNSVFWILDEANLRFLAFERLDIGNYRELSSTSTGPEVVGLVPNRPIEWISKSGSQVALRTAPSGNLLRRLPAGGSTEARHVTFANRVLVAGYRRNRITAYNLDSGDVLWSVDTDPITLGAGNNRVYAILNSGELMVITP